MNPINKLTTNEQQAQPLDLSEIVITEAEASPPPPEQPASQDEPLQRPDPTFKRVVEKEVAELGVDSKPTELKTKQLTSPDLFLEIPPGTNLEGSPFDFFRRYTIIEFKSRHDQLTYAKYKAQLSRVLMWSSEHEEVADQDLLNVIVSARKPEALFNRLEEHRREFKQLYVEVTGIYIEHSEYNDVVLVVCSELPVEPKYAIWLLFADPNTAKWRDAIRMMADNGMVELLGEAEKLNPKEYRAMTSDIEERLALLNPQEREEYLQAYRELMEYHFLRDLRPEHRLQVLSKLPVEERLKDVPIEERLKGLPTEERLKGLPTEEIARALPVEERTKELTPEQKKQLLKQLQQELGEAE